MKKSIAMLLAVLMLAGILTGCAGSKTAAPETPAAETPAADAGQPAQTETPAASPAQTPTAEKVTVRIGGLKGPTSMGMVKLLDDAENGLTDNDYTFQMAGSADELTPLLLKGELDVLAAPVNLGAILSNRSKGEVQLAAINTLGVLYIVENSGTAVTDWESLRGKTIYATGKGSTPEYALKYLLQQYGLDPEKDVTIEWKSEPAEVIAQMATESGSIAMMPQPYVTVAKGKLPELRVALDLTASWDALKNGSQLLTAGLLIRKQFAQEHPEAVEALLREYRASTEYVNANVSDAAKLVEKYDIVPAAVAEQAIPACNIVCITGEEMKTATQGYLQVLFDQNPEAVGGAVPDDTFYYAP